jgi:hypothetical protein
MTELFSSADLALAQRIERGHAYSGKLFALAQGDTAAIEEVAGGLAIFAGLGEPSTQALNIGMSGPVSVPEFSRLEEFYKTRQSPLIIDYCPLAHQSLFDLIQTRIHSVREISFVMARRVTADDATFSPPPDITISSVGPSDLAEWGKLVLQGFSEQEDVPPEQLAVMLASPPGLRRFFGEYNSQRLSASAMESKDKLATFFGDATPVPGRGRGLQLAHIKFRVKEAAQLGCDLASASVMPGGSSHRNYTRAGFQLVYPRVMFSIDPAI